ncbi:putative haloacid dehalogenase-like hydrolase [Hamiltosporidium magnivora]|uniref:Putative haloacid dehalogenase-like hydrolase n=1 Tax=Hamiltosporidium magnivora TaxID=148818 RepID=A0A4Q9L8C1_9MICR|nr:putative haloacid dehalogenase-like hydrolase [Hamiltosporidium magnivora]
MKIQKMILLSLKMFILFFNLRKSTSDETINFGLLNSYISFEFSDTFMFYLYSRYEETEVFDHEVSGYLTDESKQYSEEMILKSDKPVSFILLLENSNSKHLIKSLEFVAQIQDILKKIQVLEKNNEDQMNQNIENIWLSSTIQKYLNETHKITSKANTRNLSPPSSQSYQISTENLRFIQNRGEETDSDLFFIKYIQQWEFVRNIKLEFFKKLFYNTEIKKILSEYLEFQNTENPNTGPDSFIRLESFLECNFEKIQYLFSQNLNAFFDTTFSTTIYSALESNLYENCFFIGNNIILLNNNHIWTNKQYIYVFDIDSTLYSSETGIEKRIKDVIANLGKKIGLSKQEIQDLSQKYEKNHGEMVIEMMKNPNLTDDILDSMIEESLNVSDSLKIDMILKSLLTAIKHPKICFTNGTCGHAIRTIKALGIFSCFDAIVFCNYKLKNIIMKPRIESYRLVEYFLDIETTNIIFYDDSKNNIEIAKYREWKAILVENNLHQLLAQNT